MYCLKCRKEINPIHKECPKCGTPFHQRKAPIAQFLFLIALSMLAYAAYESNITIDEQHINFIESSVSEAIQTASVMASPTSLDPTQEKIQTCQSIARTYHATHTYQGEGVYDCDNMAQDVWNMLKAANITSKIIVGNTNITGETMYNSNHAWVLACVDPFQDQWIAIECTSGVLVYDNPQYYEGLTFNNPKIYRSYLEGHSQMIENYNNYLTYLNHYNNLVSQFNRASANEQSELSGRLNEAYLVLQDKQITYTSSKEELEKMYNSQSTS